MGNKKRIIVGMSGASGQQIGIDLLETLASSFPSEVETHLVMTDSAITTLALETATTKERVISLSSCYYSQNEISAPIASGSFDTEGMIIAPCSMKTVAGIASGYSDNLLLRSADVVLKERRKLILVVRECPFSSIHLRNMLALSQEGAIILPAVMTFYNGLISTEQMVCHITSKALGYFGLQVPGKTEWHGVH